jgi:hypothetical protein
MFHYIVFVFFIIFEYMVGHEMNIKFYMIFCVNLKKTLNDANEFTSLNVDWILDNLLCNYKKQAWVVSSTSFVKIV